VWAHGLSAHGTSNVRDCSFHMGFCRSAWDRVDCAVDTGRSQGHFCISIVSCCIGRLLKILNMVYILRFFLFKMQFVS
jgi:hypothetical protein